MIHSILIILAHIIFLHMIRKAVKSTSWLSESTKIYIHAGLCAFELGCVCLEQGVLMETAGMGVWALSLFLVVMWHVIGLDGHSPNSLNYMLEGSGQGMLCVLIMLACSLISYRHMTNIWAAELVGVHKGRSLAISSEVCSIPWKNNHFYQVILMEFIGTFFLNLLPPLILENQTLANNDSSKLLRAGLVAVTVTSTVIAGMNTSGSMYNPTLASLLVGGCHGFSHAQHILVYWVTPLIGAVLGSSFHYRITRPASSQKKIE